jgi:hypothetical protein
MKSFGVYVKRVTCLALRRSQRLDPERMDIGFYQSGERIINHSVALKPVLALESPGDNGDVEVAPAVLRAFVPRMEMTLILDQEFHGIKGRLELRANSCDAVPGHGSTSL